MASCSGVVCCLSQECIYHHELWGGGFSRTQKSKRHRVASLRLGCEQRCLAAACIWISHLLRSLLDFFLIFSRLQRSRDLVWLDSPGSPAHAFNSWLLSHGWTRAAEWKWNHGDTGLRLDLTTVSDAGQGQHVVRDAWHAWCLRWHMASDRRDTQLDCFDASGYFRRIDWHATRLFAASCSAARALVRGATFSPAALGGRVACRPCTACIWENCTHLGTFDQVAWECSHRPRFVPKPAEFLSSWVVTNQNVDITLVQSWLIEVQQSIWTAVYQ